MLYYGKNIIGTWGESVTHNTMEKKSFSFRWRERTETFAPRAAKTNKLTGTTNMPSSNIGPLIKATMFRWCVFLVRTRHLRAFPRDFVISTRFICSRLFIWDVDVFNKGNSSVKFDLLPSLSSIFSLSPRSCPSSCFLSICLSVYRLLTRRRKTRASKYTRIFFRKEFREKRIQ